MATAALKRKKVTELELERLQGTRFQLEMHINTLESASFNAETMTAIQTASKALKAIHSGWSVFGYILGSLTLYNTYLCYQDRGTSRQYDCRTSGGDDNSTRGRGGDLREHIRQCGY